MVSDPTNIRRIVLVAGVLLAALLLRIVNLDADPSVLISRDVITDEGWWVHNARNAVLYGQWQIDDNNLGLYSASLYNVLMYCSFEVFGVSYASMRMLSALAGWLTVVLVFLLVRREVSARAALFASVLLGFSNLHIIYSRTGFVESTMVFFLAVALSFWTLRHRPVFAMLSGIAFALMLITKITAIYFLPGLILVIAAALIRRSVGRQEALLFGSGLSIVGAVYLFLFVVPHFGDWLQLNLANGSGAEWPSGPASLIYSTLKLLGSSFYAKVPLITAPTLLSLGLFVVSASRNGLTKAVRDAKEIEATSAALLIGYLFSLSFTVYQPERRFLPALFLMVVLSSALLEKGWTALEALTQTDYQMGAVGWFTVLFFLPAIGIVHLRLHLDSAPVEWSVKAIIIAGLVAIAVSMSRGRWPSRSNKNLLVSSRIVFVLLFFVLALGLVYKALELWGLDLRWASNDRSIEIVVFLVVLVCGVIIATRVRDARHSAPYLLCAFLLVEGIQISTWQLQPTYTLKDASASLGNILTRDDTIVTHYETALLTTSARVICRSERRGFNIDVFETLLPKYVMVLRRDNWRDYALEEIPPQEWPPSRFVATSLASFDICPTKLRGPRFILELHKLTPREKRQKKKASGPVPE
jgi:4-amino-4-deoxy-L-arabinose transferase-like glycosyltransferase